MGEAGDVVDKVDLLKQWIANKKARDVTQHSPFLGTIHRYPGDALYDGFQQFVLFLSLDR